MDETLSLPAGSVDRRTFLRATAGLAALVAGPIPAPAAQPARGKPTQFQIACMTLVYAAFPLERALTGIRSAGYRHVAWYTTQTDAAGKRQPVLAPDATPEQARDLGKHCRDLGLEPVLMFSGVYPDAKDHLEVMQSRLRQAAAGGVPQVLTFGSPKGGDRKRWVEQFKTLGRAARDQGVLIVLKPHGGLTASGVLTAGLVHDVADESVKVNYDAGNVMDYLKLDAASTLADFRKCAAEVRSFCIKDHRLVPKDQDCGPGLGEIDHYQLLGPVAFTGRALPLCCENIFPPLLPRPTTPEGVDTWARRAREFLETVVGGLQAA